MIPGGGGYMEHGRLNVKQSDFKNVEFLIILSILKEKFAKFWVLQLPRKNGY